LSPELGLLVRDMHADQRLQHLLLRLSRSRLEPAARLTSAERVWCEEQDRLRRPPFVEAEEPAEALLPMHLGVVVGGVVSGFDEHVVEDRA
jgi:hypothetical protein